MNKSLTQFTQQESMQGQGIHVFYYSDKVEDYIQNAVSYIMAGIEQGEYILFLENERIFPMIQKELEKTLTPKQIESVHFINNFDFYFWNGNFYPETILSKFSDIVTPLIEKDNSVRTWGHVEWGSQEEFEETLEKFEIEVDQMLKDIKVISVCAYNAERVSDDLKDKLMRYHDYFMTDEDVRLVKQ
ncbi:MEDS domain-containing protein [Fictibacillus enclensis]|nr:MEDS domain-containing protein [Fictibacillus enclensis]